MVILMPGSTNWRSVQFGHNELTIVCVSCKRSLQGIFFFSIEWTFIQWMLHRMFILISQGRCYYGYGLCLSDPEAHSNRTVIGYRKKHLAVSLQQHCSRFKGADLDGKGHWRCERRGLSANIWTAWSIDVCCVNGQIISGHFMVTWPFDSCGIFVDVGRSSRTVRVADNTYSVQLALHSTDQCHQSQFQYIVGFSSFYFVHATTSKRLLHYVWSFSVEIKTTCSPSLTNR